MDEKLPERTRIRAVEHVLGLARASLASSEGQTWTREELHDPTEHPQVQESEGDGEHAQCNPW